MSQRCCRALTAECLSCMEEISEKEFCLKSVNKNVVGCEKYYNICGI